nr:SDR family oxidoreductase [Pontibacter liquoris]
MKLDNANILITGGTLGIGRATAKLLIEHGANVAITGRDASRTQEAAAELGAMAITADVGNSADVQRTFDEFMNRYGRLDVLINNAGIGLTRGLDQLTVEDFETIYRVNVFGAAMMAGRPRFLNSRMPATSSTLVLRQPQTGMPAVRYMPAPKPPSAA